MSSSSWVLPDLPLQAYHRASQIGEGSFGAVLTVYNDQGEEYALKLFETNAADGCIDLGALRELSCLRILQHDHIIRLVDVQSMSDEDTNNPLAMVLPLYSRGTLSQAAHLRRSDKVTLAHGLLSAVAHLHDHGILHRDIKTDNVLVQDDPLKAILIDFSCAKPLAMDSTVLSGSTTTTCKLHSSSTSSKAPSLNHHCDSMKLTNTVGTVTYMAPELVDQQSYGRPVDLWSVGVVLLELLTAQPLVATKNAHAFQEIQERLATLPRQPFADLLRGLLNVDPAKRLSAREALRHSLFVKHGLEEPPVQRLAASRLEEDDDDKENAAVPPTPPNDRRWKRIQTLCRELDCRHPWTARSAYHYCHAMEELDDELEDTQTLLDCVVLAVRFWEVEALNVVALSTEYRSFRDWDLETYRDTEATLLMLLNYCLYPTAL